jgi:hypothetical protein
VSWTHRDNRVYLNPSGMSGIHAAGANVINSRHNGFIEQARRDIVDLALLSSLPDLMEIVEQMEKETNFQLELISVETSYGYVDEVAKKRKKLHYIDQRNTAMLAMVIRSLSASGIWAKILKDVANNTRELDVFR